MKIGYIVGLVLVAVAIATTAGCDLGDVVQAKTPQGIQQTKGLPSKLSLNEAESEYQAWLADVTREGAQWRASIERADEIRGILGQLSLNALNEAGPTLAGVPVLGPSLPLAAGLLGLFVGNGRLRKEKEASYNKGLERGQQIR